MLTRQNEKGSYHSLQVSQTIYAYCIQLFRERLSEKVWQTIYAYCIQLFRERLSEKGTCDNPERPWTYLCKCLRIATKGTKVGSTATVPGTVYLAYPILPFGIVKCTFFQTTFLEQLLTEHNENTIAAINHQRAIRIKFRDNSRLFIFR